MAKHSEAAELQRGVRCIHHYMIDDSNLGICKKCGGRQQFPAYHEIYIFNNNISNSDKVMLARIRGGLNKLGSKKEAV